METRSDHDLLLRWRRDRDDGAFAELARRHGGLVHGVCRRALPDGDAADAAQATFLLLARRPPRLGETDSLSGWLHATARHVAANARRAIVRREARERTAYAMSTPSEYRPETDPRLDDALAALGDRDRRAILLRFADEKSFAEIGRTLGMAENTARMCVNRALDKLRGRLGTAAAGIPMADFSRGLGLALRPVAPPLDPTPAAVALASRSLTTMTLTSAAKLALVAVAIVAVGRAVHASADPDPAAPEPRGNRETLALSLDGRSPTPAWDPAEGRLTAVDNGLALDASTARKGLARLVGRWDGGLAYADGQTGRKTRVPATMEVRLATGTAADAKDSVKGVLTFRNGKLYQNGKPLGPGPTLIIHIRFPQGSDYDATMTLRYDAAKDELRYIDAWDDRACPSADFDAFARKESNEFAWTWKGIAGRKTAYFRHRLRLQGDEMVRIEDFTRSAEGPRELSYESKMKRVSR